MKSRTSITRARFQPKASSSATTSASNINAIASPNAKHLNGDHPSYADVASDHPTHIEAHTNAAGSGNPVVHHHEDHSASYAEVAAEGVINHHDEHAKDD